MVFCKWPKTKRILVSQINIKGKHFLSKDEEKKLFGGSVSVTEKYDGANCGLIKLKDKFRLQKRGSLVDTSEHLQFQMFKAWSNTNYDKIMSLPNNHILYGEWCAIKHTIFYDMLPDYFLAFALYDKSNDKMKHRDDLVELCEDIGFSYVHEIFRGPNTHKEDLFNDIPDPSMYGHEPGEGLVVENLKNNMRGKVVREQFQKSMDTEGHWARKAITKNIISDRCSCVK